MTLALFDLDNTLLNGDSDYLWGEFLVEREIVDAVEYKRCNQQFYDQYKRGTLDINEFLRFSLKPLSLYSMDQLLQWHQAFMKEKIIPLMTEKSKSLVESHRAQQHTLMIITATNRFITEPIAKSFGIPNLLASEPELINNRYTGKPTGVPCFQQGKITRLMQWLEHHDETLEGSWFYSDSYNDLPMLEIVSHPVVVNPDERLAQHAKQMNWDLDSLL